jgi:hypothetical protein
MKTGAGALAIAVICTLSTAAFAEPTKKQCLAATDEGQNLRDQGKLAQARADFQLCSAKSCPSAVAKQCAEWFAEVEKDTPSLLFRAKSGGKEVTDVKVTVDDKVVAESIGSEPFVVDPGTHSVKMERNGAVMTESVLVRAGEKNHFVDGMFEAAPEPPKPPPPKPISNEQQGFRIPLLGWVGAGVFVAGGATTAIFAIMAHGDESDLRSSCAPHCTNDDRDSIKTKLLVANVGMFVGIAGLALAGVTTFMANRPVQTTANGFSYRF